MFGRDIWSLLLHGLWFLIKVLLVKEVHPFGDGRWRIILISKISDFGERGKCLHKIDNTLSS